MLTICERERLSFLALILSPSLISGFTRNDNGTVFIGTSILCIKKVITITTMCESVLLVKYFLNSSHNICYVSYRVSFYCLKNQRKRADTVRPANSNVALTKKKGKRKKSLVLFDRNTRDFLYLIPKNKILLNLNKEQRNKSIHPRQRNNSDPSPRGHLLLHNHLPDEIDE